VLTNPDSLHHFILPGYPRKWSKSFWANLTHVVIDEAHVHRGVAGSHFANVIRRVIRLCRVCGNDDVRFVCTSATISNPREHVLALTTKNPTCVTVSGAPSGEKAMILWQPPELAGGGEGGGEGAAAAAGGAGSRPGRPRSNNAAAKNNGGDEKTAQRRSAYAEAAEVIASLVKNNVRCLAFVSARSLTESVCRDARELLVKAGRQDLALLVDSYRAGYSVKERRNLEHRLASGEVSALVCTSALEMGIDVGTLDATVHVGVPETASAMWQQAGRAGRRRGCSLAVVVAAERPLDGFYLAHPSELFKRRPESALIDPANVSVLEAHLPCAAFETPIDPKTDCKLFDAEAARLFRLGAERGETTAVKNRTPFLCALRSATSATPKITRSAAGEGGGGGGGFSKASAGGGGGGGGGGQFPARAEMPWNNGEPTMFLNKATKIFQCRQFFRPHHHVMLRGAPSGGDAWTLLDVTRGDSLQSGARELEKIEAHRAMSRIYPGCVHLSRHGQYKIERHDANARVAYCREYANPEVTYARERTAVMPLEKDPSAGIRERKVKRVGMARVFEGRVRVVETIHGYVVKRLHTQELIDEITFNPGLPGSDFVTDAVWWDLPGELVRSKIAPDRLRAATQGAFYTKTGPHTIPFAWSTPFLEGLLSGPARVSRRHPPGFNPDTPRCLSTHADAFQLHPPRLRLTGALNVCAALVPAVAMCDARDVLGACDFLSSDGCNGSDGGTTGARMYLYDACPNGVGLASKTWTQLDALWEKALATTRECKCASGCPSCTQAGARGRDAGTEKKATVVLLEGLLGTWMRGGGGGGGGGSTCAAAAERKASAAAATTDATPAELRTEAAFDKAASEGVAAAAAVALEAPTNRYAPPAVAPAARYVPPPPAAARRPANPHRYVPAPERPPARHVPPPQQRQQSLQRPPPQQWQQGFSPAVSPPFRRPFQPPRSPSKLVAFRPPSHLQQQQPLPPPPPRQWRGGPPPAPPRQLERGGAMGAQGWNDRPGVAGDPKQRSISSMLHGR